MPFRGRRRTSRRIAIVACSLLAYLFSVGPAAATVVYCISDDGHEGFELVAAGERGCASCCHDLPSEPAHEGFPPTPTECTDIALSSDQAPRTASVAAERETSAFAPDLVAILHPPSRLDTRTFESARTDLAPPRGSPSVFLRHTVLLI
jgi:hypothetical protein